jgi:AcrR family transcriptional regulator
MPAKRAERPSRPGRPVGSDGAVTRERLLRSAREVFAEHGYEKSTPALVAEGAGLSRTAFYRYFDSKAELYRALIDDVNATVIDELFGAGAAKIDDPAERVAWLFRASARFNADDRSYGRFLTALLVEAYRDPAIAALAEEEVERFRRFFDEAVSEAEAAGVLAADRQAVVDLLLSLQWGLGLFAAFIGDPDRLAATIEVVIEGVLPGIVPRGPGE